MKCECIGVVVAKETREWGGAQRYSIRVEEGGTYPSYFEFTTKDPTIYASVEVGNEVKLTGFANGRVKKVEYQKDGVKKSFDRMDYWFTLIRAEKTGAAAKVDPHGNVDRNQQLTESDDGDIPF